MNVFQLSFRFSTFLLFFIVLNACKEDDSTDRNMTNRKINYTNVSPSIIVTSIDSLKTDTCLLSGGYYSFPTPINDSMLFLLDINKDSISDFEFLNYTTDDSQPFCHYDKIMRISGLNENSLFFPYNDPFNGALNQGDTIDATKMNWTKLAFPYMERPTHEVNLVYPGDHYLALRVKSNNNVYYGWMRINVQWPKLTIYEYALAQQPSTFILAGEK